MQDEIDGSDDKAAKSTKRPRKVSNFHVRIRHGMLYTCICDLSDLVIILKPSIYEIHIIIPSIRPSKNSGFHQNQNNLGIMANRCVVFNL